jgi:hypothetical protein
MEDKINKLRRGLELAKEAYLEKFQLDPDLITEDGPEIGQFEYIQQFENLGNIGDYQEEELEELESAQDQPQDQTQDQPQDQTQDQPEEQKQNEIEDVIREKKRVESVSVDISDLVTMSLKNKQEEARLKEIEEQEEGDSVYIQLKNNPTKLRVNLTGLGDKEIEVFNSIRTLLEGKEIFKKFSNSISICQAPFNPFENKKPESCGFGKRMIRLNPEDIGQILFVKKLNIRKDGYYIEKRGKSLR